ncbi:MAG: hypothetical protein EMLJLAPB_00821 [Candidatus Argoarchaeum ethanivorans]|uniref:Uncharacterized protein n=1 Tax=Candidatus Argoarchaeum ethanivorans TaxID=2608793 RepID=A0A811TB27_9EURY|nr:MAG: hypothetical protein EMLJLAPB_00821 [Candidatus Argoarchaeum ethanivorans]
MNTKILTIILLVALTSPLASADWSQFHYDPERTGNVSGDAPLTDTLLWKMKPSVGYIGGGASIVDRNCSRRWACICRWRYIGIYL